MPISGPKQDIQQKVETETKALLPTNEQDHPMKGTYEEQIQ